MNKNLKWIATPNIQPDNRGPVDRAYIPFVDPARAEPIIGMLQTAALQYRDRTAIEDKDSAMSYEALFSSIINLAAQIERMQSAAGPIGILLPPGNMYVIAVFAILAASRISVLLDESYPANRNAEIAAKTGIRLVLIASDNAQTGNMPGVQTLNVAVALTSTAKAVSFEHFLGLDEPAFIICTSGSAGLPKPIVHSQRTMLHWARTTHDALHVRPEDRALSLSSLSTLGGFTALLSYPLAGASTQMFDIKSDGLSGLISTLTERPITILRTTPSLLRGFAKLPEAQEALSRLRIVQTFGEPLMKSDLADLRAVLPNTCYVRSTYGATEASGFSWFAGAPDDYDNFRVATGTLMPDTFAALVDDNGEACMPGEAGELWIKSRYNALGEWHDGQVVPGCLEADISDPLSRIFRTGDIGKYRSDGVFVVLGRKDRMVKINGQRLEPAEVEAAMLRSPGVKFAEVVLQNRESNNILIAFVVPSEDAPAELAVLVRRHLRDCLPSFMLPAQIIKVSSFPLLPGGKIDQTALLAMVL